MQLEVQFRQNYSIAHGTPDCQMSPLGPGRPGEVSGTTGIAYTYNEPSIWYEYSLDTARLVKEKGLKNVLVTTAISRPSGNCFR